MAGDSKTEKATPKRRRDERKKGNVLMSKDAMRLNFGRMDSPATSIFVWKKVTPTASTAVTAKNGAAIVAFFDYLYQWWDYERQLRMSKQEIKEEYKQTEGDPQIKGSCRS